MHDGVHVDHRHRLIVPHDGREGGEETVFRFDLWYALFNEGFAFVDPLQIDHHLAELASRPDLERLQNAPALPIGNAPAIELVRQGREIVTLRLGDLAFEGHGSRDAASVRYGDFFIGPSRISEADSGE